ncbi:MAG: type I-E CRISPR-associated protein Cse1/CasA [Pseudorhodoplanes sp.]
MPYNLLVDPLAPFLMTSGEVRWLAVADITSGLADGDYAVEPAWPRTDLDTATYEFLIGLLSFALPPRSTREWAARYRTPPCPDDLRAALAPLVPAFNVDGEGPLFMQERGLESDTNPVEALFIDTPGANTQKKNSDLLTHRDRYGALCLPAAGMALYALQAFAPSGGAGNLTSMRGGGPLSTLVIPLGDDNGPPLPLWHKLWANVALHDGQAPHPDSVFAWLRADLPVGKGEKQGGIKLHQGAPPFDGRLHPFFGMPRRIRLVVSGEGRCDLTGREGPLVTGFVQRPYGLNYGDWRHPLTPYRRQKPAETPYSVKPKSGRFGYRDWVAVTVGDCRDDEQLLSLAAENVRFARGALADHLSDKDARPQARIRVAGWAMSNMEAISYLAAEQPLPLAKPSLTAFMDELARDMGEAGDIANGALRFAVKTVLGTKDDKGVVEQARIAFYADTDDAFYDLLGQAVLGEEPADREDIGRRWLAHLRRAALAIFDASCPVPLEDAAKAEPVVRARGVLIAALTGYGKTGDRLFKALLLPQPSKTERKKKEAA